MSYDIDLNCPVTNKVIKFDFNHNMKGGTYAVGGTNEASLNVTYNYAPIFYKLFHEKGIHTLYGMSGSESISLISTAILKLSDDVSKDYWECTEGNVKKVLYQLLSFAKMRPDGIWSVD